VDDSHVGFLDRLGAEDRAALLAAGRRRPMRGGETLFREGDDAYEVLIVLKGIVKIWIGAPSGRQVILDVLDAGSVLGELSSIDGAPRSANAGALEKGELLVVPMARFRAMVEEHPRIGLELLHLVAERLRVASRRQLEFSTSDSLGRLCGAIVAFADRFGTAKDGVRQVLLPMGQSDLASWNGLSREAIVKGLRALRSLGWVEGDGRHLRLVDERALRDRAQS
jgi:CRP/FNR family cyclic AMP-dependent transcriptional regulator